MTLRENSFGKSGIVPTGSIDHLDDGTYYLTKIDDQFIRYYAIKDSKDSRATNVVKEQGSHSPTLPKDSQAARRLHSANVQFEE